MCGLVGVDFPELEDNESDGELGDPLEDVLPDVEDDTAWIVSSRASAKSIPDESS